MRSKMNHDFQFGHERFESQHVTVGADHFYCHCRLRFRVNTDRLALQDPTECSGTQLLAFDKQCNQIINNKLFC